jgi:hypothetical protein
VKGGKFEEVLMSIVGRESAQINAVPVEGIVIAKKSKNQSLATGLWPLRAVVRVDESVREEEETW